MEPNATNHVKSFMRDCIPPVIARLFLRLRPSKCDHQPPIQGCQRDAAWYDESFPTQYLNHYTKSNYYALWAIIGDRIKHARFKSILDLGCGAGQMATFLRDLGVSRYLGIDFSPRRIQRAKAICPEFDFAVADLFETPAFETRDYDCVVCTEVLEHLNQDLDLIKRVRGGTRFLASVPNFPWESHVRHFENADMVTERYGDILSEICVHTHRASEGGHTFFLIDGIWHH